VVTLFVGVPVKSASLLLVHAAVPVSQFNAEVSHTPLFVPDHVCVAANTGDEANTKVVAVAARSRKAGNFFEAADADPPGARVVLFMGMGLINGYEGNEVAEASEMQSEPDSAKEVAKSVR